MCYPCRFIYTKHSGSELYDGIETATTNICTYENVEMKGLKLLSTYLPALFLCAEAEINGGSFSADFKGREMYTNLN